MIIDLDRRVQAGKKEGVDARPHGLTLALGFFDGMHLGHGALMDACLRQSARDGSTPAVLLLEPHPLRVLANGKEDLRMLNTLREKIYFIRRRGIEQLFLKNFDLEFAKLSPEGFVQRYLMDLLGVRNVVVGFNYKFGDRGLGDPGLLERFAYKYGFGLKVVQPVYLDGQLVSSTLIRERIQAGEMEGAARLMGHWHLLSGRVTEGDRLGRQLGFPTANVPLDPMILPPPLGVYAARAEVAAPDSSGRSGGELGGEAGYQAVVNIGTRPTVAPEQRDLTLEAHLLDFDGDLYGKEIRVSILRHIRNERRFESLEALKAQVNRDIETVKEG
jgi:riboflavin kinase/FMN adenylyltransferase